MRSLKECYEIAKKYHAYWTGDSDNTRYMCIAAEYAFNDKALTKTELSAIKKDAMSLVDAHDPSAMFLIRALGDIPHEEVKAYWNKYIDNMENQDG